MIRFEEHIFQICWFNHHLVPSSTWMSQEVSERLVGHTPKIYPPFIGRLYITHWSQPLILTSKRDIQVRPEWLNQPLDIQGHRNWGLVRPQQTHYPNIVKKEVFAWMSMGQMLFIVQLRFFSEPTFSYFWNPNSRIRIIWPSNGRVKEPALRRGWVLKIASFEGSQFWGLRTLREQQKILRIFQKLLNEGRLATISICNLARLLVGRRRDFFWALHGLGGWVFFCILARFVNPYPTWKTNMSKEKQAFEDVMYLRSGWGFYIKSLQ